MSLNDRRENFGSRGGFFFAINARSAHPLQPHVVATKVEVVACGNHNTGMDVAAPSRTDRTDRTAPAALAAGLGGIGLAQLVGGAPLAAAVALCTWAAAQLVLSGRQTLAPAAVLCGLVAVLAVCSQWDLAARTDPLPWRAVLIVDTFVAVLILGRLVRKAVRS
ncbi:MAG: hypothetical protein CMJ58_13715 [Planctomycetaceae bacterium]|nr:hypothetical protein [Planctomycetaceae bacterium]